MITEKNSEYDYIIAGAGCAGLSLALALKNSSLKFKRVLIIDAKSKTQNDRTWCFWTKEQTPAFASIIARSWHTLSFSTDRSAQILQLNKYRYHLIRGIDFYNFADAQLKNDARFDFVTDFITQISTSNGLAKLETGAGSYTAPLLFNSAFRNFDIKDGAENLVQHFVGWKIRTQQNCFDKDKATFMDFSVEQYNDCRFVYILPFSETEAIVEYTGFSKSKLSNDAYKTELQNYLHNYLKGSAYEVVEIEQGVIPMYESPAVNNYGSSVIAIGTAAGASKASTGFTFYFIQQHCKQLVTALESKQTPTSTFARKKRFLFYDAVLLHLLFTNTLSGKKIFSTLFKRNKPDAVFDFLNEQSTFLQELRLFITLPLLPFSRAALRKFFK